MDEKKPREGERIDRFPPFRSPENEEASWHSVLNEIDRSPPIHSLENEEANWCPVSESSILTRIGDASHKQTRSYWHHLRPTVRQILRLIKSRAQVSEVPPSLVLYGSPPKNVSPAWSHFHPLMSPSGKRACSNFSGSTWVNFAFEFLPLIDF